jgi:hypothetical protein
MRTLLYVTEGASAVHAGSRGFGPAWEAWIGETSGDARVGIASAGWIERRTGVIVSHVHTANGASTRLLSRQEVGAVRVQLDWTSNGMPALAPLLDTSRAGWHGGVSTRRVSLQVGTEVGTTGPRRRSSLELSGRSEVFEWNAELSSRQWPLVTGARLRLEPRAVSRWHWSAELRVDALPDEPVASLVSVRVRRVLGPAEVAIGAKAALGRALSTVFALGNEVRLVRLPKDQELLFARIRIGRWESEIVRQPTSTGMRLWGRAGIRWGGVRQRR